MVSNPGRLTIVKILASILQSIALFTQYRIDHIHYGIGWLSYASGFSAGAIHLRGNTLEHAHERLHG